MHVASTIAQLEELVTAREAELQSLRRELRAWEALACGGEVEIDDSVAAKHGLAGENPAAKYSSKYSCEREV